MRRPQELRSRKRFVTARSGVVPQLSWTQGQSFPVVSGQHHISYTRTARISPSTACISPTI